MSTAGNISFHKERFMALDIVRGVAILWIVCFHILVDVREQYGELANFIIKNGHLGVELFFVISGFGICRSIKTYRSRNLSPWDFLKKRIFRIYSVYLISLVFTALIIPVVSASLSTLKGDPFQIVFFKYSFWEWVGIATLFKVFLSDSWLLNLAFLPINGVVWYISILVQIYCAVTIAMLYGSNYFKVLLFITILSTATLIPQVKALIPYGLFLPYWIEFFIGMILFTIIDKNIVISYKTKSTYFLFLVLSLFILSFLLYFVFSKILFCLVIAYLFWYIYPLDVAMSQMKIFMFFKFLGSFSYSLYLLHVPVWSIAGMFARNLIPFSTTIALPFAAIPFIIVTSYFWFLFFEKPGSLFCSIKMIRHPLDTIKSGFST